MKFVLAALAISIATGLTACQSLSTTESKTSTKQQVKSVIKTDAELKTLLAAHTWAYQANPNLSPITLGFSEQRLSIDAGCNMMGAAWDLNAAKITTQQMISTMKGCNPELMKQESFAAALFKTPVVIAIDTTNATQPILTIETATGQKYQFLGTQTAETRYQGQAETIFLEVAAETKPCTGVAPQQCLQVREIKYNESGVKANVGEWQLFYGTIEGFEHDPKLRTVLRLKRFTLAHPAADQSKYAYVHDLTVEQELVK